MITIKQYQYEEIDTYAKKIHSEVDKMVGNCSSYMAMDLGLVYQNKFAELILFKLSEDIYSDYLDEKEQNRVKDKSKIESNEDLEKLIDDFSSIIEQYKKKRGKNE